MAHNIGSTVWVFDGNYREYLLDERGRSVGGPIYRKHFRSRVIADETPRSWVLEGGLKVPKSGGDVRDAGGGRYGKVRVFMTAKAVDDAVWLNDNAWRLANHLRGVTDVAVLRKVAEMTDYREWEGR